jgi:hypothetical protein
MTGLFGLTAMGVNHPLLIPLAGFVVPALRGFSWAATVGIGITSRFKAFRIVGYVTAAGVAAIYLAYRALGYPLYSFFGITGLALMAMEVGVLVAWWRSRRQGNSLYP